MRRLFFPIVIGCGLLPSSEGLCAEHVAPVAREDAPSTRAVPRESVFDLRYREMSVPENTYYLLMWNSWGISTNPMDEFTRSLSLENRKEDAPGTAAKKVIYVRTPVGDSPYAALELHGTEPAILHIDLNCNKKLDNGETLRPFKIAEIGKTGKLYARFETPTFRWRRRDGTEVPYKLAMNGFEDNAVWSSGCVWEGSGRLNGERYRFIIAESRVDGDFTDFGSDRFILVRERDLLNLKRGDAPARTLTRRFAFEDACYNLSLSRDGTQAILAKEQAKPGTLKVHVADVPDVTNWTTLVKLFRPGDQKTVFDVWSHTEQSQNIPAGRYRLRRGTLYWRGGDTSFWANSEVVIKANQVNTLTVGRPFFILWAGDTTDAGGMVEKKEGSFRKGDTILIHAEIWGLAQERYFQFRVEEGYRSSNALLSILNERGDKITSGSMGTVYSPGFLRYSWKTDGVPTGRYTIVVRCNTGPLAGVIEGRETITIE